MQVQCTVALVSRSSVSVVSQTSMIQGHLCPGWWTGSPCKDTHAQTRNARRKPPFASAEAPLSFTGILLPLAILLLHCTVFSLFIHIFFSSSHHSAFSYQVLAVHGFAESRSNHMSPVAHSYILHFYFTLFLFI